MSDEAAGYDPDALSTAAQAGLAAALPTDTMLVKFVAIMEVIESDGRRALWTTVSPDCKAWESMGMLQWALACENAAAVDSEDDG